MATRHGAVQPLQTGRKVFRGLRLSTATPYGDNPYMKDATGLTQYFRMLITLIVLMPAVWVIISGNDQTAQKWAIGIVGTILGYWLRGTP